MKKAAKSNNGYLGQQLDVTGDDRDTVWFLGLDPAFFAGDGLLGDEDEYAIKVQDWYQFIKDRLNEAGIDPTAIEFVYLGGASRGGALSYLLTKSFIQDPNDHFDNARIVWGGFDAVLDQGEAGLTTSNTIQNPRWEDGEANILPAANWPGNPTHTQNARLLQVIGGESHLFAHAFAVESNEYQEHSLWNQRWVDLGHEAICQCPNDGPCHVDGEEIHEEDQYSEVVSRHLDFANAALGEPIGKAWVSLPDVGKEDLETLLTGDDLPATDELLIGNFLGGSARSEFIVPTGDGLQLYHWTGAAGAQRLIASPVATTVVFPLDEKTAANYRVGDFDNDGSDDLLVSHGGKWYVCFIEPPSGTATTYPCRGDRWTETSISTVTEAPDLDGFAVANLDRNGDDLIHFAGESGIIGYRYSTDLSYWTTPQTLDDTDANAMNPSGMYSIGDVNGDGDDELVLPQDGGVVVGFIHHITQNVVWKVSDASVFDSRNLYQSDQHGLIGIHKRVKVVDMDQDGCADLIVFGKHGIASAKAQCHDYESEENVFRALNSRRQTAPHTYHLFQERYGVGDFDGDGEMDLFYSQ
jgi:hypothetical protein